MNYTRFLAVPAVVGLAALLSGCVVAPIGPRHYGAYPRPVYVEPAAVVVVPAPAYHGHRHRYWR